MASGPLNLAFKERNAGGPYSRPIKCKVVAAGEPVPYRGKDGSERASLTAAVSDGTTVKKLVAYDVSKFKYLKVGQSMVLREVILRNEGGQAQQSIVVTKNSKIFMSGPLNVPVPEHHTTCGLDIVNPPPAETVSVKDALGSPAKKKISVSGRIVQEDEPRHVNVRGEEIPIKTITIEDDSQRAKVTLWRDCSKCEVRPGDNVEITDVVINIYNNVTTLQTTMLSKLKKKDIPETKRRVTVVGIAVTDGKAELLLDDDASVICNEELLGAVLATPDDLTPDVEMATAAGPLQLTLTCKGSDVVGVSKI